MRFQKRYGSRLAVTALVTFALGWPAGAAAGPLDSGTPQYPDIQSFPPYELRLWQEPMGGEVHHLVRFSTLFANLGQGPLELRGEPHFPVDGTFDAYQRVYQSPVGFQETRVGTFAYHPEHTHFHFGNFTRYELWTRRSFDRALASNFKKGQPMLVGDKVSFCMFDTDQVSDDARPVPFYSECTPLLEGISVGWADEYDWSFPGQWIDVGTSPLPDGDYVVRAVADPDELIIESQGEGDPARESEVANDGFTAFSIVNGALVTGP